MSKPEEKSVEEKERDTCVVLGVLIEEEQWRRRNEGRCYYGGIDLKGGDLSYFDNMNKTALHNKGSEDYLYLRVEDPKLKGTYIPVEKGLIRKLISDAIQKGEASTSFEVSDLTIATRPTAPKDRLVEHQAYEQESEQYDGRIDLHLKFLPNYVHELLCQEAALWSIIPTPKLEFTVKVEGSTRWI
ncbi:MAG: hypothetical protein KJ674_02005 [Nanoarchaeota archaeon]|nr:hypothetical protein [Nanoarchaeota archaeon]